LTGLAIGWYCDEILRGNPQLGKDASIIADFVLLVVAFVWGLTFIMVKQSIAEVGVYPFLFLRFTLSFL